VNEEPTVPKGGNLHVYFTTLLHDKPFSIKINAQSEFSGLLENIQKSLREGETQEVNRQEGEKDDKEVMEEEKAAPKPQGYKFFERNGNLSAC
jgi:hypothetical protein